MLPSVAFAESWYLPNQAGGQIILTDTKCPNYSELNWMYARNSSGQSIAGCWTVKDGFVQVAWDSGGLSSYPANQFKQLNPKGNSGTNYQ